MCCELYGISKTEYERKLLKYENGKEIFNFMNNKRISSFSEYLMLVFYSLELLHFFGRSYYSRKFRELFSKQNNEEEVVIGHIVE